MIAAALAASNCVILKRPYRSATPFETWIGENKTFRVRVSAYEEKEAPVTGAYYLFESTSANSTNWHEIMTLRHDDQPAIPKNQIRFLNDRIGYVFMEWMYAVTTDGGNTWSVWNAIKDVPDWQWSKYGVISDVRIEPDGTGKMVLKSLSDPARKVPDFRTNDFGRHWRVE